MGSMAFQAIGDDQRARFFVQANATPMNDRIRQSLIPIMESLYRDKLLILLDTLDLAVGYVTPEKGASGHRLIFFVYADRVVSCSAAEIRPPQWLRMVAEGAGINQKLETAIAKTEAEGIGVTMGVEGRKPERSDIEDDRHFIVTAAICGEDVITSLWKRLQTLIWH